MFDLLGPKSEADLAPAVKNEKKAKAPKAEAKVVEKKQEEKAGIFTKLFTT